MDWFNTSLEITLKRRFRIPCDIPSIFIYKCLTYNYYNSRCNAWESLIDYDVGNATILVLSFWSIYGTWDLNASICPWCSWTFQNPLCNSDRFCWVAPETAERWDSPWLTCWSSDVSSPSPWITVWGSCKVKPSVGVHICNGSSLLCVYEPLLVLGVRL